MVQNTEIRLFRQIVVDTGKGLWYAEYVGAAKGRPCFYVQTGGQR